MKNKKIIYLIIISIICFGCDGDKNQNAVSIDKNGQDNKVFEEKSVKDNDVDKEKLKWEPDKYQKIIDIPLPKRYERVEAEGFAEYLRELPLKTDTNQVLLYDGSPKGRQSAQFAVLDLAIGNKDLEQCADAVMRLRADYFYRNKEYEKIAFNFTNGFRADYKKYAKGNRISVNGNRVSWTNGGSEDYSKATYRKYLEQVYTYAGTLSLSKELQEKEPQEIEIGDVFIEGGSPGHAVIVVDMAVKKESGEKVFLLAQSYMPAQEIHVLINPNNKSLSPWYEVKEFGELVTPEWIFDWDDLKSF